MNFTGCLLIGFSFIITISCSHLQPSGGEKKSGISKVYVANSGDNSLSVIDPEQNAVRKTISVGKKPVDLALSPDQSLLAVANEISNTIQLLDTQSDQIVRIIELDSTAELQKILFISPETLLAAIKRKPPADYRLQHAQNSKQPGLWLVAFDLENGGSETDLQRIKNIYKVNELTYSPSKKLVAITGDVGDAWYDSTTPATLVDLSSDTALTHATLYSKGAQFSSDGRYLYTYSWLFGLYQIDTNTLQSSYDKVKILEDLTIHPTRQIIYSTSKKAPIISTLDLQDKSSKTVDISWPANAARLLLSKEHVYLVHTKQNCISVFDLVGDTLSSIIPVGNTPTDLVIVENINF